MTTASELFATLHPGDVYDAKGEAFDGDAAANVPDGVTVRGATFIGYTDLYQANALTLDDCTFLPSLRMLGGNDWAVTACTFRGGVVMSQLNVGQNWNVRTREGCPMNWLIEDCLFEPLDGQAGDYPQGHQLYVLTTPRFEMGGVISRCTFSGSPFGATIKLGGTGNFWRTEGVRGVTVEECDIDGIVSGAGEVVPILTQGSRTDVTVRRCTMRGDGDVRPGVAAMDGARCRLVDNRYPDGIAFYARWYGWVFGLWSNDTTEAIAGRRSRGGVRVS